MRCDIFYETDKQVREIAENGGSFKVGNYNRINTPSKDATEKDKKLSAWKRLQKYAGIVDRDIDVKAELEAISDEKYKS